MRITLGAEKVRIYADCDSDISTASVLRIYYRKPLSRSKSFWTATLGTSNVTVKDEFNNNVTLEANTYCYYDTVAGDIDIKGDWKTQAYVELSGGLKQYGDDDTGDGWALLRVVDTL